MVDATRHEADVVLIDAPPVLSSAGQAVMSTADAVLLVVTRRLTRRDDVLAADDRIRRVGSRLVGTAVRESDVPRGRGFGPAAPDESATPLRAGGRRELPGYEPLPPQPVTGAVYQPQAPADFEAEEPPSPEAPVPPPVHVQAEPVEYV